MIKLRIGLMALALAGALALMAQDIGSELGDTKLTAKKYEFTPNIIRVKKGERVGAPRVGAPASLAPCGFDFHTGDGLGGRRS